MYIFDSHDSYLMLAKSQMYVNLGQGEFSLSLCQEAMS